MYSPTKTSFYPTADHHLHHHHQHPHQHQHQHQQQHLHQHHQHHQPSTVGKVKQKSKRVRTIFTPEQLKRLEQEFNNQMYLVGQYRCLLAESLNLSEAQVKVWFQNRRIKFRKCGSGPTSVNNSSSPSSNQTSDNEDHHHHQHPHHQSHSHLYNNSSMNINNQYLQTSSDTDEQHHPSYEHNV